MNLTLEDLKKDRENLAAQLNAVSGALNYVTAKIREIEEAGAEADQEEKTGALRKMRQEAGNNIPKAEARPASAPT
jgi:prefoldin subunit 5